MVLVALHLAVLLVVHHLAALVLAAFPLLLVALHLAPWVALHLAVLLAAPHLAALLLAAFPLLLVALHLASLAALHLAVLLATSRHSTNSTNTVNIPPSYGPPRHTPKVVFSDFTVK